MGQWKGWYEKWVSRAKWTVNQSCVGLAVKNFTSMTQSTLFLFSLFPSPPSLPIITHQPPDKWAFPPPLFLFYFISVQTAWERLSLLALGSDKIWLYSLCLSWTCLFWMALLIAIDSHRMWMAVLLDTRLMLLTFPPCPQQQARGDGRGGQRRDIFDSNKIH